MRRLKIQISGKTKRTVLIGLGILLFINFLLNTTTNEKFNLLMTILGLFTFIVIAFLAYYYFPAIIQKEFIVKRLTTENPSMFGSLKYVNKTFVIKGLFFQHLFNLADILAIKGYTEVTFGLEDTCCIDFIFRNGKKILFDGSFKEQQELVNKILIMDLNLQPIDWSRLLIFKNDDGLDYQTIYKNNNSR